MYDSHLAWTAKRLPVTKSGFESGSECEFSIVVEESRALKGVGQRPKIDMQTFNSLHG